MTERNANRGRKLYIWTAYWYETGNTTYRNTTTIAPTRDEAIDNILALLPDLRNMFRDFERAKREHGLVMIYNEIEEALVILPEPPAEETLDEEEEE